MGKNPRKVMDQPKIVLVGVLPESAPSVTTDHDLQLGETRDKGGRDFL